MESAHKTITFANVNNPGDEYFAIKPLLSNPVFARFYAENRPRIPIPIYWQLDPKLRPDTHRCGHWLDAQYPEHATIRLPYLPAPAHHARNIAHELSHLLLDFEGFPGIVGNPDHFLPSTLGSLLTDALIDRRLTDVYGFSHLVDHQKIASVIIGDLERLPRPPRNSPMYSQWILSTADIMIDYETVTRSSAVHPIYSWFMQHHPGMARQIDWVMATIHSIGYDTPAKYERVLRAIINRFNLTQFHITIRTEAQRESIRDLRRNLHNHLPSQP